MPARTPAPSTWRIGCSSTGFPSAMPRIAICPASFVDISFPMSSPYARATTLFTPSAPITTLVCKASPSAVVTTIFEASEDKPLVEQDAHRTHWTPKRTSTRSLSIPSYNAPTSAPRSTPPNSCGPPVHAFRSKDVRIRSFASRQISTLVVRLHRCRTASPTPSASRAQKAFVHSPSAVPPCMHASRVRRSSNRILLHPARWSANAVAMPAGPRPDDDGVVRRRPGGR